MHVGAILIFEGPPPALRRPRRARPQPRCTWCRASARSSPCPPLETGRPLWVDDPNFNLDYHVRHTALPDAGRRGAAAAARRAHLLAAARPLEAALGAVAGRRGSSATASRSSPRPTTRWSTASPASTSPPSCSTSSRCRSRSSPTDDWVPQPEPSHAPSWSPAGVDERRRAPVQARRRAVERGAPPGADRAPGRPRPREGSARSAGLRQPGADVPLNQTIGSHRRFVWARAELADFKRIKNALGGTVNDVVLAVVSRRAARAGCAAAAIRTEGLELRALVPGLDPRRGRARPARQPDRGDARAAAGLHRGPGASGCDVVQRGDGRA